MYIREDNLKEKTLVTDEYFSCFKKTKNFMVTIMVKIYWHITPFQLMPNFYERNRQRTGFYIYTF